MKLTKVLSIALLVVTGTTAFAQQSQQQYDADVVAQQLTMLMTQELSLDDDQQKEVMDINQRYAEKTGELLKSGKERSQMYKEAMKMESNKDKELKAVFTDKQYDDYVALKKAMRKQQQQQSKGGQ